MVVVLLSLVLMLPQALQSDSLEVDPELFVGDVDAEAEAALLQEHISELAATKLSINTADERELLNLPGIGIREAHLVVAFRSTGGRFTGRSDLIRAGLDPAAVDRLLPFVDFGVRERRSTFEVIQRLSRRLQIADGFRGDSSAYAGDPTSLSTRIKLAVGQGFRAGIVFDKDAGETLFRGSGFDFSAGYVHLQGGHLQSITIGDYAMRVGEGLLLRQGTAGGSFARASVARPGRLIRPYASTSESGFFRGIALQTRELFGASLVTFISRRRVDGRVDSSGAINLLRTGLHRTIGERATRGAVLEEAAGAVLGYRISAFRTGISTFLYRHTPADRSGAPAASRRLSTAFFNFHTSAFLASLEFAIRRPPVSSSVSVEYEPSARYSIAARWRRSRSTTTALHTAVATGGTGRAEDVLNTSLHVALSPALRLAILSHYRRYVDERQPFLLTSSGADARVEFQPRPWISAAVHLRQRHHERGAICAASMHAVKCAEKLRRRSMRFQVDYAHSASFRARMRVEAIAVENPEAEMPDRGLLLFEDLRWSVSKAIRLDLRLTLFDTAGYESRAYAVENDLLYSFSSPVLIGRGRRTYVLLTMKPTKRLSIQMKYASTIYEDVIAIGSGRDRIAGPRVSDFKIQLRWSSN